MIQVAQILFILSVLVILHEFGHYAAAKIFKVRVEKFYLFMDAGFSILKKKIGETEWGIGWLPIGGYVKLSGMIDESMDTEQMKQPAQPWEFRSKPAWQRLIIMMGGIIVNILLAILIYTLLFSSVGQKYVATSEIQKNGLAFGTAGKSIGFQNGDKIVSVDDAPLQKKFNWLIIDVLLSEKITLDRHGKKIDIALTDEQKGILLSEDKSLFMAPRYKQIFVDSVLPKSAAQKAGLQKNDAITDLNGSHLNYFDELTDGLQANKNKLVVLTVLRKNNPVTVNAMVTADGKLGFVANSTELKKNKDLLIVNKLSFFNAIPQAINESWQLIVYNVKQFKLILKPKTGAYKKVSSPIGIARMLPETWDWEYIWSFTALFSIGLAFMNCLPIPGLDGGHALFTIVEMITGKTLSEKAMGYVQTGGMVFLLSLMALTFGKDIYQLVIDKLL